MDQGGLPNPAAGVPPMLLPHVHLVSTYRYPTLPQLSLDTTVEYLVNASKVTREVSAMCWTFLDAPADGTVLLVWQPPNPSPQLGNRFPTDGYVWADAERVFAQEYKGYHVEMLSHTIGFVPPHEALATHTRRRYRLRPINNDGSTAPIDSNLWIVHYSRADLHDHVPANRIPASQQTQTLLQQRRVFQQQGQLVRKEFMLHDRQNWPRISMPQNIPPQYREPAATMSHFSRPGQQPYIGHGGPSPAKRQRQSGSMQRPTSKTAASSADMRDSALEDEQEEMDLFDMLTPRDISSMRFTKHHEWMEEVLSSSWDTRLIDPVPLGHGRKGALSSLTDGYLDAPTEPTIKAGPEVTAEKMGKEKLAEFTARVKARIAAIQKEKEDLSREHAKRLAEVKAGSIWRDGERALRVAAFSNDPNEDRFKLEAGYRNIQIAKGEYADLTVDDIVGKVEQDVGKKIVALDDSKCVKRGGLEEKVLPPPEPIHEDTEMIDGGSDDLDVGPNFTEFNEGTDDVSQPEASASLPTTQVNEPASTFSVTPSTQSGIVPSAPSDNDKPGDDWVMVDKQQAQSPPVAQSTSVAHQVPAASSSAAPDAGAIQAPTIPSAPADLGSDLVNFNEPTPEDGGDFGGGEFDAQIDFESIDTAGEALAGFDDNGAGDVMDQSAFGDAFHHTESESTGGQNAPTGP